METLSNGLSSLCCRALSWKLWVTDYLPLLPCVVMETLSNGLSSLCCRVLSLPEFMQFPWNKLKVRAWIATKGDSSHSQWGALALAGVIYRGLIDNGYLWCDVTDLWENCHPCETCGMLLSGHHPLAKKEPDSNILFQPGPSINATISAPSSKTKTACLGSKLRLSTWKVKTSACNQLLWLSG